MHYFILVLRRLFLVYLKEIMYFLYLVLQKQKQDIQLLGEDHRDIFKLDKARKYQYKRTQN